MNEDGEVFLAGVEDRLITEGHFVNSFCGSASGKDVRPRSVPLGCPLPAAFLLLLPRSSPSVESPFYGVLLLLLRAKRR